MKILLEVNDNKAGFFMELIKSLSFVKIKDKEDIFELSFAQKAELDKIYSEYISTPENFIDWDVASKDIEKKL